MGEIRLTRMMRRGLEWFLENGEASHFDWYAPSSLIRKRLLERGLIEECGKDPVTESFCFVRFRISDAGRAAIKRATGDTQ